MPIKNSWMNTRLLVVKSFNLTTASGNFDPSNPTSFYSDGNGDLVELVDEFVAINNEVVDYTHELGLTVWTHNCRGNYEIRSASEGTYEDIAKKFLAEQHYDRFFLEWDSDTAGDIKALKPLKTVKLKLYLGYCLLKRLT